MAKFADKTGQEWEVEITHGHLKALKKDHGLDLRDALKSEHNSLAETLSDPERFGQLLWFLCGRQAEAIGLSPEDFAYRFNGQTMRAAGVAVYEAVMDFFQGARAATRAGTAFRAELDRVDGTLAGVWDQVGSRTSGNGAGNSPAPPASLTPAR